MAEHKCDVLGHEWCTTTAPGWFRCLREIGYSKTGKVLVCNTVAVCPGCLGTALVGMLPVFCVLHQGCSLEDFPVFQGVVPASPVEHTSYEQVSLW